MPTQSRISGFYKHTVAERLNILRQKDALTDGDFNLLKNGQHLLAPDDADKMIENVIGVFGLPLGVGLNFLINGRDYLVPMVVEEPSIVAAVSAMAKIVRDTGGFICSADEPILIGQIQVVDMSDIQRAQAAVLSHKRDIISLANIMHPNLVARGGGVRDVEARILPGVSTQYGDMLIVHLLVDVRDAMGANLVNSLCEGVAGLIEKITGGKVFLRILSNLADRSLARAECVIPVKLLADPGKFTGESVRDGMILANEFALADPYRAATHNKGIMNGIDPLVIATGNDWRAVEAAAHAYAARDGQYRALTLWSKNERGDLVGRLELPMRVGTVGAQLKSNPAVLPMLRLLGVESARELAEILAAVGLAQNMGALRALATEGIQRGHMSLHARSVVVAANVPTEIFELVVERLIQSGEIKEWKARDIAAELAAKGYPKQKGEDVEEFDPALPTGYGKIILFGEHAVVYGSHAIAAPLPIGMQAKISDPSTSSGQADGVHVIIPRWGVEERLRFGAQHKFSIFLALEKILSELQLQDRAMRLEIFPHVPRAMGLGGSAALAVAIVRALSEYFKLNLSDEDVWRLSYLSETIVHGAASGIDNTLATYGKFLLFKKNPTLGAGPFTQPLQLEKPLPIVIGLSWTESLTAPMVTRVRQARIQNPTLYDQIFDQINTIVLQALEAIQAYDLDKLGDLMNVNQGLLNALQVSTRELEELVDIARKNGALGAKLTGSGGGGAMIALCRPGETEAVAAAIKKAGYKAMAVEVK